MLRTSRVHHQEDHLYMQFVMACFSCIYVSSLTGGRMCSMSSILPTGDWPCQLTCRPVDSRMSTDEGACLLQYWELLMSVSHLSVVATYFFDLSTTWMGLLWYKFVACKNVHVRERKTEIERQRERGRSREVMLLLIWPQRSRRVPGSFVMKRTQQTGLTFIYVVNICMTVLWPRSWPYGQLTLPVKKARVR